jgi:Tfp pilus assembly protein PilO
LVFALAAYLTYTYVVTPQLASIDDKETTLLFWERQATAVASAPAELAALEAEHEVINSDIQAIGEEYFSMVSEQEELILLMNELLMTPGIRESSIQFSQPQRTSIAGGSAVLQTINTSVQGTYESVWAFLRGVWAFEERIMLSNLTIAPGDTNQYTGNLSLSLYDLSNVTNRHNRLIHWFNREDFVKDNPFTPLPGQPFLGIRYLLASDSLDQLRQYVKFADIGGHWAEDEIDSFGEQGLVFGDANNRFYPDSPISRGELVVLLDGYFKWPMPEDPIDLTQFIDFREIGSYESNMARAVFKGFLNQYIVGYGDGYLRPNAPVSYAEFNDIMSRIFEDPGFSWEDHALAILETTGHRSVGLVDLSRSMTRAEAIYFLTLLPTP